MKEEEIPHDGRLFFTSCHKPHPMTFNTLEEVRGPYLFKTPPIQGVTDSWYFLK